MQYKGKIKTFFSSIVLVLGALFTIAFFGGYRLCPNLSSSMPYYFFISQPVNNPVFRGEMVGFHHPTLKIHVVKSIVGLPGDLIRVLDNKVFVNDFEVGPYQTISKTGKSYTVIAEGIIPEGFYFGYAPAADSYDSRYQEFGLIPSESITEELWLVF